MFSAILARAGLTRRISLIMIRDAVKNLRTLQIPCCVAVLLALLCTSVSASACSHLTSGSDPSLSCHNDSHEPPKLGINSSDKPFTITTPCGCFTSSAEVSILSSSPEKSQKGRSGDQASEAKPFEVDQPHDARSRYSHSSFSDPSDFAGREGITAPSRGPPAP
jgi:hypothetical protein